MSTISEINNRPSCSLDSRVIYVEGQLDGHCNMARDAALLESECEVAMRVYGWEGAWVTLGNSQHPKKDLLPNTTVPYAMRPTGGKAVLHGHDITLGMMMHLSTLANDDVNLSHYSRQLKRIYREALAPFVLALNDCGIPAALGETLGSYESKPHVSDCFLLRSANDIVHVGTGAKVCGVAMRIANGRVLLQCSIPVREPLIEPSRVFPTWAPVRFHSLDRDKLITHLIDRYKVKQKIAA